mmetsp:Transcript_33080/g.65151  ORF Transcript_33080/g.65151 Transcript_33080/m.65151 type:complete len:88 (+) Transcript_33080:1486-1749(+)
MPISSFSDFVLTRMAGACPGRGVVGLAFAEAVGRDVGVDGLDGPVAAEGLAPFPAAPTDPGRPAARMISICSPRFLLKAQAHGWTAA